MGPRFDLFFPSLLNALLAKIKEAQKRGQKKRHLYSDKWPRPFLALRAVLRMQIPGEHYTDSTCRKQCKEETIMLPWGPSRKTEPFLCLSPIILSCNSMAVHGHWSLLKTTRLVPEWVWEIPRFLEPMLDNSSLESPTEVASLAFARKQSLSLAPKAQRSLSCPSCHTHTLASRLFISGPSCPKAKANKNTDTDTLSQFLLSS